VLDLFSLDRWRVTTKKPPQETWRSVKYYLLFTILFTALLGNLTLLVFDPLTILYRTLSASVWPALDQIVTALERLLYQAPFLSGAVVSFDAWVRPVLLPTEPVYNRAALVFAILFLGITALNLAAPRFWCRYLCPLGGLLGLFSKVALVRREVSDGCKACQLCTQVCPTGTIDPELDYASDPAECTMCMDCLEACPRGGVAFKARLGLSVWREYDPGRRHALAALGTAAAGTALFRSLPAAYRKPSHLLRPPGALDNDFLSICVRCGECVRVCPSNALQPAMIQDGPHGVWAPAIVPRLGYCDYSCNACGQICPVGAIPALTLEDKRVQVIGRAYIDTDRCIAWGDHQECIVCEEMCPVPDKAVRLEEEQISSDGSTLHIQLPYVERDLCIGCGICENKCPVNGEAAIRVYIPGDAGLQF
jgi:MauM/NapG family ferredoxin protein